MAHSPTPGSSKGLRIQGTDRRTLYSSKAEGYRSLVDLSTDFLHDEAFTGNSGLLTRVLPWDHRAAI